MLAALPTATSSSALPPAFTNVVVQVVMNMGLSDKITVVGYDMGEQTATQILDEKISPVLHAGAGYVHHGLQGR